MNRGASVVFCHGVGSLSHSLYGIPHSVPCSGHIVSTHSLIFTPYNDRYKFAATAPYANVQRKMNSTHCSTPGCALPSCIPICIYLGIRWWHQPSGPIPISQLQSSMRFSWIWVPLH